MAQAPPRFRPILIALVGGCLTTLSASAAFGQSANAAAQASASNATVTIASGSADGRPDPSVEDIARLLPAQRGLRALAVVGHDDQRNIVDLLAPRAIDLALVRVDRFEDLRANGALSGRADELRYVVRLFEPAMHVLAGSKISDLRQLANRRVAVGATGSPDRFSAEKIFARLGVSIDAVEDSGASAIERLRRGDVAAVVIFAAPPDRRIAALANGDGALRLVGAPWDAKLADLYLPATIDSGAYPDLLRKGERIETISVGDILLAAQAKPGDARASRLAAFVDAFFTQLPDIQRRSRNVAWRDVNLAAKATGLTRLAAAQDWLDGKRGDALRAAYAAAIPPSQQTAAPAATAPSIAGDGEFEKFKRFVSRKRGKTGERLATDDTVVMFEQFQKWRVAQ